MAAEVGNLHWADVLAIVLYFAIVMAVGIWSSCRNRGSVGGYFLAGRNMNWIPVGASLFASNIGSGHFVGLAGSGAASGIGISAFELNAIFVLLLLGWVFVPVYICAGVYTMPEYLRKRFGGQRIRVYLSVLALLLYVFTKISADLYAGYIFINQSMKVNLYLSIVILLLIAAAFTIAGGLTAVMWTDFIQTIIMIAGAFVLMILAFIKIGGYNAMVEKYFEASPNSTVYANESSPFKTCGVPPSTAMHLVRPYDDPTGLPWPGIFFGLTISAVWYWCSDQVIVQRALSAKNFSHAKAGCILAAWLKFLPLFLIVFPGMIARALYKEEVACADPDACAAFCGQRNGCTNTAYPLLVIRIMPNGLRGVMLAVMMSALMSSLTSIFNSSSTIFTMDIWRLIRKQASDIELMVVGRVFVLALVAVSVAWIPVVQGVPELFHYIQAITSFLAPPICAVYVLAILWKRINEQGAFWSLMIGLVVGLVRFIAEYSYGTQPPCGVENPNPIPAVISKVHYLHFGIILFTIVALSAIVISLLTEPMDPRALVRLTFWNRHSREERIDISELDEAKKHYDNRAYNSTDEVRFHGSRSATLSTKSDASLGAVAAGAQPGDVQLQDMAHTTQRAASEEPVSCPRRALYWICGIENMNADSLTIEEQAAADEEHTSIYETQFWKRVLNVNAVGLVAVAIFVWCYYG